MEHAYPAATSMSVSGRQIIKSTVNIIYKNYDYYKEKTKREYV